MPSRSMRLVLGLVLFFGAPASVTGFRFPLQENRLETRQVLQRLSKSADPASEENRRRIGDYVSFLEKMKTTRKRSLGPTDTADPKGGKGNPPTDGSDTQAEEEEEGDNLFTTDDPIVQKVHACLKSGKTPKDDDVAQTQIDQELLEQSECFANELRAPPEDGQESREQMCERFWAIHDHFWMARFDAKFLLGISYFDPEELARMWREHPNHTQHQFKAGVDGILRNLKAAGAALKEEAHITEALQIEIAKDTVKGFAWAFCSTEDPDATPEQTEALETELELKDICPSISEDNLKSWVEDKAKLFQEGFYPQEEPQDADSKGCGKGVICKSIQNMTKCIEQKLAEKEPLEECHITRLSAAIAGALADTPKDLEIADPHGCLAIGRVASGIVEKYFERNIALGTIKGESRLLDNDILPTLAEKARKNVNRLKGMAVFGKLQVYAGRPRGNSWCSMQVMLDHIHRCMALGGREDFQFEENWKQNQCLPASMEERDFLTRNAKKQHELFLAAQQQGDPEKMHGPKMMRNQMLNVAHKLEGEILYLLKEYRALPTKKTRNKGKS